VSPDWPPESDPRPRRLLLETWLGASARPGLALARTAFFAGCLFDADFDFAICPVAGFLAAAFFFGDFFAALVFFATSFFLAVFFLPTVFLLAGFFLAMQKVYQTHRKRAPLDALIFQRQHDICFAEKFSSFSGL
jgi:hypothetical protein